MPPGIPNKVAEYADKAFSVARARIQSEFERKQADAREELAGKGLGWSSVMDRNQADLKGEEVSALVRARAACLVEGYEMYSALNDEAVESINADVALLYEATIRGTASTAVAQAKDRAWRTREASAPLVAQAQEYGRQLQRSSAAVLNEVSCELEKKRASTQKATPSQAAKPAAVRPIGPYSYHPEIERVSLRLCEEGNFRQAVLDAFIHLIDTVRNKTGLPYDGDDLMNRAFAPDGKIPPVRFNNFQTQGEKDEQRGFWLLFKGIVGLRNFKAHVVASFDDPHRAHEYLALASLLMRLLDTATIDPVAPKRAANN